MTHTAAFFMGVAVAFFAAALLSAIEKLARNK